MQEKQRYFLVERSTLDLVAQNATNDKVRVQSLLKWSATTDKDEINNSIKISEDAIKYFEISKERFYDASSYSAEYLSSTTYAKDLNKQIKQLEELFLPGLKKSLEQ